MRSAVAAVPQRPDRISQFDFTAQLSPRSSAFERVRELIAIRRPALRNRTRSRRSRLEIAL